MSHYFQSSTIFINENYYHWRLCFVKIRIGFGPFCFIAF